MLWIKYEASPKKLNCTQLVIVLKDSVVSDEETLVTLDALNTKEDDELSYYWKKTSGTAVELTDINKALIIFNEATASHVNISLPEINRDEVIEVQVTVSDGDLSSRVSTSFTVKNRVEVIVIAPDK